MPPESVAQATARIALAGNPNTGKTSLFNRVTGLDHKVGNYPGITVDRHQAPVRLPSGARVELLDVPGTYSLSARSAEEQLAIQAIAGLPPLEPADVAIVVIDATQLSRNLYLALQVIELGVPVVLAITMSDLLDAEQRLDLEALGSELKVPVVDVSRGTSGEPALLAAVDEVLASGASSQVRTDADSDELARDIAEVERTLPAGWAQGDATRRLALARWALLSLDDNDELQGIPADLRTLVAQRHAAAAQSGRDLDAELIRKRYDWIDARMPRFQPREDPQTTPLTDRVDSVLLHPIAGFAIFLTLMGIVFQSLFSWADPMIGWVEDGFGALGEVAANTLPEGLLQDFVVEGLIAGVGSVVVFLPQILLLFLFVGLMEDTGYMARVAFLMDRIMKALGLHGRAFVPMLSGFACAIPAVMATRTMERQRDRFLTMMVVPLMTCSARLPVYSLLIAALFPPSKVFGAVPVQGLLMVAMYVFSTVVALIAAAVLSRTLLKGPNVPLILELPPYRLPLVGNVLRMMWQKSRLFLTEAGTVILVCTIGLWLLLSFPQADATEAPDVSIETVQGEQLRNSYGGRLGRAIEPVIEPLGFDWKIGVGLIGAFAAREVFVSTMGVVYGVGGDVDEESVSLRDRIKQESNAEGRPIYTPLVGLSLMVFFALACQCMSTIAAVKRETATYRWPLFMFAYMTVLAWVASFVVYQGGRLLGFE